MSYEENNEENDEGLRQLKIVYIINDKCMYIRIYAVKCNNHVSIECSPLCLDYAYAQSAYGSRLWENTEWMVLISDTLLQEKTEDGKYYTVDSKGRKEECYLIVAHTEKKDYRGEPKYTFNILCPINREFIPIANRHFVVPSEVEKWFCQACLPSTYIQKHAHVLDLLPDIGSIDECGKPPKIQKTGYSVTPKSNVIDFTIDTDGDKTIYLGICHYCGCAKQ